MANLNPENTGEELTVQIDRIAATLEKETPPLAILDLSATPHLASTGIGAIVRLFKTCLRIGTRFAIVGVSPGLLEMFTMMQLDRMLAIHDSVADVMNEA